MDRRKFLSNLVMVSGGAVVDNSSLDAVTGFSLKKGFSILQGFTDETTTQFTIDVPKSLKVYYEAFDPQTGRHFEPTIAGSVKQKFSLYRVDKIIFENMYLGAGFQLLVKDSKNNILDQREFNTLDTSPRAARVALLSCMFDFSAYQKDMWKLVHAANPEVIFFLGDNVYGDIMGTIFSPEVLWYRYINSRRMIAAYRHQKLTPTISTWDDHDFGCNNVNGTYKYKKQSTEIFEAFYAQVPLNNKFARGPGISSSFTAFGRKFILLDGRSYRELPCEKNGISFMGQDQLQWFNQQMRSFNGPVYIMSGSQFFGAYTRETDSYEGVAPDEFLEFRNLIKAHRHPAVFVSGDVHFSELMKIENDKIGYTAFELTSSCLHSFPNLKPPNKNSRRVDGATRENFLMIDFAPERGSQYIHGLGVGRRKLFGYSIDTE